MRVRCLAVSAWISIILALGPAFLSGQVTQDDYERAFGLREKFGALVLNLPESPGWIGKTSRFYYRKTIKDGSRFIVVDASTLEKKIAFDHEKLAAALSSLIKDKIDPKNLPFRTVTFIKNEKIIEFDIGESRYTCDLITYVCKKKGPARRRRRRRGFTMWQRGPFPEAASKEAKSSPDGKWEAFIKNYNLYIRSKDKSIEFEFSTDGSEGNFYTYASITWSPDSKKLAANRLRRGYHRVLQYVESSPAGLEEGQQLFHF